MKKYLDLTGTSNVESYEIGATYIEVWFNGTARGYRYSYGKAGRMHVESMKTLARNGRGLNGYINSHVKYMYD